jgi:twitching motility protein PilT
MDISKLLTFTAKEGASDCHISAGEPPMIRMNGDLKKLDHPALTTEETHSLIYDMMSDTQRKNFEEKRECDFSFELGDIARFRVNVFIQNRGLGAVFRNIPTEIIPLEKLGMPPIVRQLCDREKGLILVTGPTGSGKSTTLASMVDYLNNTFEGHIITIEDPIEFLHNHKCSTIHQRELHSDTPSFAHALRSAMRQAPKVILVGEMRDRETMEIVLEAAETGHLVLSSLNTMDASKTIERIVGSFSPAEQSVARERFAKSFRYIVCQRLMPKSDRSGRIAVFEILKANARTRECIEKSERESKSLLEAIKAASAEGMQHFDGEIARLVKNQVVDFETGLSFATNPAVLGQELAR